MEPTLRLSQDRNRRIAPIEQTLSGLPHREVHPAFFRKIREKVKQFFGNSTLCMITPPRMKSGTAKIGVELAPEKVLFKSWTTEPPFPIKKIGAIEPRIMLTPIGMDTAIAIRKTTNTK